VSNFQTTNWPLVAAAASAGIAIETHVALNHLCEAYWRPVHAFVCRSVRDADRARDLTQSFFARILEHPNDLANVDPERGRFRAWLLGALRNFLANEWRTERAQKRGGHVSFLSLDALSMNGFHAHEPVDPTNPEHLYDRQWALTVLERSLKRLDQEHAARGPLGRFERLRGFLVGTAPSYEALAEELGVRVETLRVEICRLRKRFRDLLRAEIRATVQRPADVDDEIRHLLTALSDAPWTLG
jgi:RNA polymerase sigma-70 factor (ECF subfamily)